MPSAQNPMNAFPAAVPFVSAFHVLPPLRAAENAQLFSGGQRNSAPFERMT